MSFLSGFFMVIGGFFAAATFIGCILAAYQGYQYGKAVEDRVYTLLLGEPGFDWPRLSLTDVPRAMRVCRYVAMANHAFRWPGELFSGDSSMLRPPSKQVLEQATHHAFMECVTHDPALSDVLKRWEENGWIQLTRH